MSSASSSSSESSEAVLRKVCSIPAFAGLGVRENENVWWCLDLLGGGGGGSCFFGEVARDEARLPATMALASWSPVIFGVIARGLYLLKCAGIDLAEAEEVGNNSNGAVAVRRGGFRMSMA